MNNITASPITLSVFAPVNMKYVDFPSLGVQGGLLEISLKDRFATAISLVTGYNCTCIILTLNLLSSSFKL